MSHGFGGNPGKRKTLRPWSQYQPTGSVAMSASTRSRVNRRWGPYRSRSFPFRCSHKIGRHRRPEQPRDGMRADPLRVLRQPHRRKRRPPASLPTVPPPQISQPTPPTSKRREPLSALKRARQRPRVPAGPLSRSRWVVGRRAHLRTPSSHRFASRTIQRSYGLAVVPGAGRASEVGDLAQQHDIDAVSRLEPIASGTIASALLIAIALSMWDCWPLVNRTTSMPSAPVDTTARTK